MPPLIIAILLLQGTFLGIFWRQHRHEVEQIEVVTTQQVQELMQDEMERDVAKMDTAMEVIIRDRDLADALARLDRQGLVEQAQPIFEQFRTKHEITHFYFHQPDRHNFLRLHKEQKGDLIDRSTIQTAERTGKPSAGLEQGPTGNPVLRLVYPWRSDFADLLIADLFADPRAGNLIGYLELGIEFEDIARRIHDILNVELIIVVDKSFLDAQRWDARNRKLGRQSNWDEFTDSVIIDTTIAEIPVEVSELIENINPETEQIRINQNGQTRQVIAFPFNDINGTKIGYIVALKDISVDVQQARQSSLIALILTLGIGTGLVSLSYVFLGKVEKNLSDRTRKLASAKDSLAASKAQLEEYSHTLEQKVKDRTHELQSNNHVLQETLQELKKTQVQLIQGEKMSSLGQMVAGVAHEINNPVNFIYGNVTHAENYSQDLLGLVQLYESQYPDPAPAIEQEKEDIELDFLKEDLPNLLRSMKFGAQRIQEIVKSLRNFSRLDEAEAKSVDIHEGLDSTLLILHNRLKDKGDHTGIEVMKEYGQLPLVDCFPGQLNQVFMNIISNAIDALTEFNQNRSIEQIKANPSQIKISTRAEGDWVIIEIADNGPGMSKEVAAKLFDPFFTTKPVGAGTGLGLSISYQIITEKHGGKLICTSEPGQGATFTIKIPK
ncbi:sensor histidine kinase [Thalassoporum mexicanum]|uniref:sensor histidine kinase n=1 Tax=Thalassoporum mexicanum TaxID=3457544 RepID=UPI0018DB29CC|nr:ATP-binding protein [Pseudanabaena sp. PCC 7367]